MSTQGSYAHHQLYQKLLEEEGGVNQQDHLFPDQPTPQQGEERVEMVIQYGTGQSASVMVGANDDPQALAQMFCFQHNIDPRIIATLAHNITSLQNSTFHHTKETSFKIERNQSRFDDKENHNNCNRPHQYQRSSMQKGSKMRVSRSKTGQSSCNESAVFSNSQSRISTSSQNRQNVFDRLYNQSKRTSSRAKLMTESRISQCNRSMNMNESGIRNCLNIYEKNTKLKAESQKHNERLHQIKQQKQLEDCRFKPQINTLSHLIACKLRQLDQQDVSKSDRQLTKLREYLLKREQKQLQECTFKPKIIARISQTPRADGPRYRQLHEDHQKRENKKKNTSRENIKNEHYQPQINSISNIIVKKTFNQRLEADTKKRTERKESQQKMRASRSAEKKPATGRPPVGRDLGNKTVGEYLYEKSRVSRGLSVKEQPQILTDPRSSQIHALSKRLAFQYLFQLLDNDQDGLISSTRINIDALDEDILKLLAPLLSEMEEVDVELNAQEFQQAFQRLFSTFSVHEKDLILKSYKNKTASSRACSERPSFHPTLNEKSLLMAREMTPQDSDIYTSSCMKMREKQGKLARLRAEKMLFEYSQCTFHPNIGH